MLKNLFQSAWKSQSAEKRLQFVQEADAQLDANQSIFENLAKSDEDHQVRFAALAKINNAQFLYDLSHTEATATHALKNLIKSGNLSENQTKTFLDKSPSATALIASFSPSAERRHALLQLLTETEQAAILTEVAYSNTRVKIAEHLQSIEALESARKQLKGKDKSAEKIIKSKIDAIHAQQKRALENASLVKTIREKMEALARYIHWSDEIRVKFFSLSKQWDDLDFAPENEEANLYQTAFTQVKEDVKHNMALVLSQQNQESIVRSLESMVTELSDASLETCLLESQARHRQFHELSQQWKNEVENNDVNAHSAARFTDASKAIQSALNLVQSIADTRAISGENDEDDVLDHHAKAILQASKDLKWSKNTPVLQCKDEAIAEAKRILQNSKTAKNTAKEALDALHKRISRLFGIAKRGDINRANRELNAVLKASEKYLGFERSKLDERIEEATATVRNMGDWKDFALEPKLLDLCEKMENLAAIESPDANQQAKKIKHLQDEWKALGSSDVSDTYWTRFKEAGDKAYEPCSVFFKQRHDTQKENLLKREPFITDMQVLLDTTDWDAKPDYKAIEDKLSQLMQAWKKIKDVEHSRGQKQWETFIKIKRKIDDKLAIEYDKNIDAKYALIKHVENFLAEDINEQSLDKLKFLQSKWKQVGVTRRKQDQAAWVTFKAASDGVYNKIQDIRKEKRSAEDEEINAYKAIHSQIHQLAKTAQDIAVSDKAFDRLEAEYKDLPALAASLPEKLSERLQQDYRRACDAYSQAKDRLNQEKMDQEFGKLVEKSTLCAQLEQLSNSADEAEVTALEEKINQIEINNKETLKRFNQRLKQARDVDRKAYTEARRLLLIDTEILLGKDSPAEDKEQRLKIQLERMTQQGIGNAPINTADSIEAIKLDWLCLPGAETAYQKAFETRFEALFKA